jgi:hypothetical protein
MKLKAACIVVAVLMMSLAAWSQDHPKAEISIDYSYAHFAAIDFTTKNSEFFRAYNLNGGGGSAVWDFSRLFGLKVRVSGVCQPNSPGGPSTR